MAPRDVNGSYCLQRPVKRRFNIHSNLSLLEELTFASPSLVYGMCNMRYHDFSTVFHVVSLFDWQGQDF